jgi:hypothetical protein
MHRFHIALVGMRGGGMRTCWLSPSAVGNWPLNRRRCRSARPDRAARLRNDPDAVEYAQRKRHWPPRCVFRRKTKTAIPCAHRGRCIEWPAHGHAAHLARTRLTEIAKEKISAQTGSRTHQGPLGAVSANQADTKDLDDIPYYWPQAQQLGCGAALRLAVRGVERF